MGAAPSTDATSAPIHEECDPCQLVRSSTRLVTENARDVRVASEALPRLAELCSCHLGASEWDEDDLHFRADASENGPDTAQFLFVVDALNFCFWPAPDLEYAELVSALKRQFQRHPDSFSARRLSTITAGELQRWFDEDGIVLPATEERSRCLRQLGAVLACEYGGLALNLVRKSCNSAVRMVYLITSRISAFRDEAMYGGRQVFFYKRAQILVGDIWGAYGKSCNVADGPCAFPDIDKLTMFADYRVPQILREAKVLVYSDDLARAIDGQEELPAGGAWEVEIRAATVQAVEQLRELLATKGRTLNSVEVDWLLWTHGEQRRRELRPHHRTLSIFY